jgi:transposase-like protein
VIIGVLTNGQKFVLAVESGQREAKESWGMRLRDLRWQPNRAGSGGWWKI